MNPAFQPKGQAGDIATFQGGQQVPGKIVGKLFDLDRLGAVGADRQLEVFVVTGQLSFFDLDLDLDTVDIHYFAVVIADIEIGRETLSFK